MTAEPETWFLVNDAGKLDTPALVVHPDRVKYNIGLLKSMIDDASRLRPHIKTAKCCEAVLMMQAEGINKFKCATIAEAEVLGMCNAKDVLLAYQPFGPKLNRFINLIKTYTDTGFSCLVDNKTSAEEIATAALENNLTINVYIDINVGMDRTGIHPDKSALQLYEYCAAAPGINMIGLHVYDGHIHESNLHIRTTLCNQAFEPVEQLKEQLIVKGYNPVVIAGGTPTFVIHAKRENIECSPGTFIYWDSGYQSAFAEQPFLPAALLVTRVISAPDSTKICTDLGHKSVASEGALDKRVVFLNATGLAPVAHSEEHLVLSTGNAHSYEVGEVLYAIPYHICPTVALYERAITISNNTISGEWLNIARDRKITI